MSSGSPVTTNNLQRDKRRDTGWAWPGVGLVLPLLVVWSVQYPPQIDTLNHLARHYLESLALRGEPLPPGYAIDYRILPNLGGDLVIPLLMQVWEPVTAMKVFLSLAVVLFWLGAALFILEVGGYRRPAVAATMLLLPFVLNISLFWGFLNYYSGVGLAFLVLVHLLRLDRRPRPGVVGLLLHTALVTLLFFWHLAAVVIYAVVGGCLVVARLWCMYRAGRGGASVLRRGLLFAAPLLPAAVLFAVYSAAKAGLPPEPNIWRGPAHKVRLILTVFRGYDARADVLAAALWAAAVVVLFGRRVFGSWLLRPLRRWPLAAAAALLVLLLVLPYQWGSTYHADARPLLPMLVCLLACLGTLPVRRLRSGAVLLAAALVVESVSIGLTWRAYDQRLQIAARSFEALGREGRVLPVIALEDGTTGRQYPEVHALSMAVVTNHAFVPTLFAYSDQQPLRLKDYHKLPWSYKGGAKFKFQSELAAAHYDYLWVYNPHRERLALSRHWQRVFGEGFVSVWRHRAE